MNKLIIKRFGYIMNSSKLLVPIYLMILFITGCLHQNSGRYEKIHYAWYRWDSLAEYSEGVLNDSNYYNRRIFQYLTKDTAYLTVGRLEIKLIPDTVLFFNGQTLSRIDKMQFIINQKPIVIYKYYYGNEKQGHDVGLIFVNFELGLICVNYRYIGLSVFPETKNISKAFQEILLQTQNKSFYYKLNP